MSDKTFDDYVAWRLRRIKGSMKKARVDLADGSIIDAYTAFRDAHDDVSFILDEGGSNFTALAENIREGWGLLNDVVDHKLDPKGMTNGFVMAKTQTVIDMAETHLSLRERLSA